MALAKQEEGTPLNEAVEAALIEGNLAKLETPDRVLYYKRTCETLGLNPLTKPFDYLVLNNKLVLYANKNCTEQLRAIHKVSIVSLEAHEVGGILTVVAKAQHGDGRTDVATGAVSFSHLKGNDRANAIMKAETKAKRRVTLALCGLGMLDETEVETIKGAQTVAPDWDPALKPPTVEIERTADSQETEPDEHREVEAERQLYAEERARLISKIRTIQNGWDPESWIGFKNRVLGDTHGTKMNLEQLRKLKAALDEMGPEGDRGPALEPDKDQVSAPTLPGQIMEEERKRVGWDAFNKVFFGMFKNKGPADLSDEDISKLLTDLKALPDSLARGHKKAGVGA